MLLALFEQISNACDGAGTGLQERLINCLSGAALHPDLLLPHMEEPPPNAHSYTRYLLHEDPQERFSVFALAWNKGQITPVHGHHYWCAYTVVAGTLTENLYHYDTADQKAHLTNTHERPVGYACFHDAGLGIIHQLSNLEAPQAISLHIYGTTGTEVRRRTNRENVNFADAKQINRLVEVG